MREADGGGESVFTPPPGSPGAVRGAAAGLRSHAQGLEGVQAAAGRAERTAVGSGTWSGAAASAFSDFSNRVRSLARRTPPLLTTIARVADDYADALDTAQRAIVAAKARYDAAVARANRIQAETNADPHRTAPQVHLAQQQVDAADREAQDAIDDATRAWARYRHACETAITATEGVGTEADADVDAGALKRLVEHTEPFRTWNDDFQTVWGGLALGSWLGHAAKALSDGLPEARGALQTLEAERSAQLGMLAAVEAMRARGVAVLPEVARDAEQAASDLTRTANSVGWLERGIQHAEWMERLEGLGKVADGLGIFGDVATMIDPEDSGVMGNVDRGVAGANAALLAANVAFDGVPVAGEVVMVGTGVYLAGDYLYHHWGAFHDACDYVGGHVADAATWTYDQVSQGVSDVADGIGDVASGVEHAAGSLVDGVKGLFS